MDFHTYSLTLHEQLESNTSTTAEIPMSWHVATPQWDDYAMSPKELGELLACAMQDQLQATVTELPF